MALVELFEFGKQAVHSVMEVRFVPLTWRSSKIALSLASLRTLARASADCLSASPLDVLRAGMAIATMIAIIPTAISSSIKVKADFFFIGLFGLFWVLVFVWVMFFIVS